MKRLPRMLHLCIPLLILLPLFSLAQIIHSPKRIDFNTISNEKSSLETPSKLIEELIMSQITLSSNWRIDSLIAITTSELPYFKSSLTYDDDYVIKNETFVNNNSVWNKHSIETNEYDESGNRILNSLKDWWENKWVDGFKKMYEYKEGKEVFSISQYYQDSVWKYNSRNYKEYDDTNSRESLLQFYKNGEWVNDLLIKDSLAVGDNYETSIWQFWNNGVWENYIKVTRGFNLNNEFIGILAELWQNNSWESSYFNEYLYNEQEQLTLVNYYEFINNDWKLIAHQMYYYDENENISEIINEESINSRWVPSNIPILVNFPNGYAVGYESYKVKLFYNQISSTQDEKELQNKINLSQNYPNPFNPTTSIEYQVSSNERVSLKVYDMLGREVVILVNETKPAGSYEVEFDGSHLTSGVYFYVLEIGEKRLSRKMLLLK